MKNKLAAWIVGIGCGERKYKINNVTYTVSSCFEPFESKNSIKGRFERTIVSDFVPLTIKTPDCIMADEYVCSGCIASDDAREEDNNAVEKEN
jgi:hypothetical protein